MEQKSLNGTVQDREDELEIDLIGLLGYYREKLVYILLAFVIGALIAGVITIGFMTREYTATVKMYMLPASSDSVVDLSDLNLGTSLSNDYAELMKTRPIVDEIIEQQKLDYTYQEFLNMVTISTISDTRILTISVESKDPKEAAVMANAISEKAKSELPELTGIPEPRLVEEAVVPEKKSSPSYSRNIMSGALIGLILMLALFTIVYITDDTMRTAKDVEKAFGTMPLAVIPELDSGANSVNRSGEKGE